MTLYDILEVSPKASKEVIEKAYKALVKKYHPDLHHPAKKAWAEEMMKELNHAYETVMDSEKRIKYDKELDISLHNHKEKKDVGNSDIIVKSFLSWYRNQ